MLDILFHEGQKQFFFSREMVIQTPLAHPGRLTNFVHGDGTISLAGKKLFRPLNDHATGNFSVASSFAHGNSSVDRPFGIFIVIRFSCRRNPTVTWRTPSSRRRGKPCETFFPPSEQKKGEIPPRLMTNLLALFARKAPGVACLWGINR